MSTTELPIKVEKDDALQPFSRNFDQFGNSPGFVFDVVHGRANEGRFSVSRTRYTGGKLNDPKVPFDRFQLGGVDGLVELALDRHLGWNHQDRQGWF
jgi:hypothetical protein